LGSATYSISDERSLPKKRLIESSKFLTSEELKAFAKESNGLECSTLLKDDNATVPTLRVLSLLENSDGYSFLNYLYLFIRLSYSLSESNGSSF